MKNIVTVGGGTGSYTVLSGLKNIPNLSIKALVSMADDGGSTGVLMDDLGVLPVGDVRQCLVALSEHSDIVRDLMNYRFDNGTLHGHSFGNIFLAGLEKVAGNFIQGVEIASEILKVKGVVIPITNNKATLCLKLKNGKIIEGENKINHSNIQKIGVEKIFYKQNVCINEHGKDALINADYIILGPGNYYCSVLPNLIVKGFKKAILKSKAKIILPINLTNKKGHTENWQTKDYLNDIEKHIGKKVDIILVNNQKPNKKQIKLYLLKEGKNVLIKNNLKDKRVLETSLLSNLNISYSKVDKLKNLRSFIRHDKTKLANVLKKIF